MDAAPNAKPDMGMMISEPTFIASVESNYVADGVIASDNRGNIFMSVFGTPKEGGGITPTAPSGWKIRAIGTLRLPTDPDTASYSVPAGVVVGARVDRASQKWVAGGTSDVGTKGVIRNEDGNKTYDAKLKNKEQLIFCFRLPDMYSGEGPSYRGGYAGVSNGWTSLDSEDGNAGINLDAEHDGWYIPLRHGVAGYEDEYVTTQPIMFGGNLYISTFMPEVLDENSQGACDSGEFSGTGRLYALEIESGRDGLWSGDKKYLEFDGIKMSGFTLSKSGNTSTLLITYQVLNIADARDGIDKHVTNESALTEVAGDLNALSVTMTTGGGGSSNITSNDGVLNYWLYNN
jgi:hypothetical protein